MGRSHLASSNWYLDAVIGSLGTGYTKCYNTFSCLWWAQVSQLWILFWSLSETIRFLPLVFPHFVITPRLSNTCFAFAFILEVRNWEYSHSRNTSQYFLLFSRWHWFLFNKVSCAGSRISLQWFIFSLEHKAWLSLYILSLMQITAPCLVETGGILVRAPVCMFVCVYMCVCSRSVVSDSVRPHEW